MFFNLLIVASQFCSKHFPCNNDASGFYFHSWKGVRIFLYVREKRRDLSKVNKYFWRFFKSTTACECKINMKIEMMVEFFGIEWNDTWYLYSYFKQSCEKFYRNDGYLFVYLKTRANTILKESVNTKSRNERTLFIIFPVHTKRSNSTIFNAETNLSIHRRQWEPRIDSN